MARLRINQGLNLTLDATSTDFQVKSLAGSNNANLLINGRNFGVEVRIDEDNTGKDYFRVTQGPNGANTLVSVDSGGYTFVKGFLNVGGFDLQLGTADQTSRGHTGQSRALVKYAPSTLVINYAGDFSGGVRVDGPGMNIVGNLGVGTTSPFSEVYNADTSYQIAGANPNATVLHIFSPNNAPVLNLQTNKDTDGAAMGGIVWTRQSGQSDAHRQIAGIAATQVGTGAIAGSKLRFYAKGTAYPVNVMTLTVDGTSDARVGINTETPAARLDVNGNAIVRGNFDVSGNTTVNGDLTVTGQIVGQLADRSADLLDGYHASTTPSANTIPVLDSYGTLNLPASTVPIRVNGQPYTSRTFYVDQAKGNDDYPGTFYRPFRTIAKAIASVPHGGTGNIYVAGNYDFNDGVVEIRGTCIHLHLWGTLTVGWKTDRGFDSLSGAFHLYGADLHIHISKYMLVEGIGKLVINDRVTTNPIIPPGQAFISTHEGVNTISFNVEVSTRFPSYNPIYLGKDAYLGWNSTCFTVFRLKGENVIVKDPRTSGLMNFDWSGVGAYLVWGDIKDAEGNSLDPKTLVSGVKTTADGQLLNVLSNLNISNENQLLFGRIVQSGSNSNGSYIRYGDGTQICWGVNVGFGPDPQTITYPAAFASLPAVIVTPSDWPAIHISVDSGWGYGTIQQRFRKYDAVGNEYKGEHSGFHYIAIGRWK